mgnify:CR=1 FL=1
MSSLLLLRPSQIIPKGTVRGQNGIPSPAIAYLSSFLKSKGVAHQCLDCLGLALQQLTEYGNGDFLLQGLTIDQTINAIPKDTKLLAVSCNFSNEWAYYYDLLSAISLAYPSITIVLGGEHASSDALTILAELPSVKACIIGEGEETLFEFIQVFNSTKDYSEVKGLIFRTDKNLIQKPPPRPRMEHFEHFADWSVLPIENYLKLGLGMASQNCRALPIVATRGCPYRCTFCSSPQMWQQVWRARRVKNVLEEIRFQTKTYQVKHIEFYDMSAAINSLWFKELCLGLKDLNITWNFPSGIRPEILTKEMLTLMKESGCTKIALAPEAQSKKLRNELLKDLKLKYVFQATTTASKIGILVKFNIIYGLPGQRLIDLIQNYYLILKMAFFGAHDITAFSFVPTPGSQLFQELQESRKIPSGKDYKSFLSYNVYNNIKKMRSWNPRFSDKQIRFLCLSSMAIFYFLQYCFRPNRFFQAMKRIYNHKPLTMLELALHNIKELRKAQTP